MNKKRFLCSRIHRLGASIVFLVCCFSVVAQLSLTWDQAKAGFEAANPTMKADAISVQEMKAQEVTAFLRPNPQIGLSTEGIQVALHNTPGLGEHWMRFTGTQLVPSINYLHERQHKRELRLQSAREGTEIVGSQHQDLNGISRSS